MANLITEKQKKNIAVDYISRLISVSFLITALLGVFLLAYVIPYYIALSKKNIVASEQFEGVIIAENKENVGESATKVVLRTLDEMKAAELYKSPAVTPSMYFNMIIKAMNSNIKITKISFTDTMANGAKQILVSGISKNREGLVLFIDTLKVMASFSTVESPISDFAKISDIPFTLNIKTAI